MSFSFSLSNFKRATFHLLLLGIGAAAVAVGQDVVTHTSNPAVPFIVGGILDKVASFIRAEDQ